MLRHRQELILFLLQGGSEVWIFPRLHLRFGLLPLWLLEWLNLNRLLRSADDGSEIDLLVHFRLYWAVLHECGGWKLWSLGFLNTLLFLEMSTDLWREYWLDKSLLCWSKWLYLVKR